MHHSFIHLFHPHLSTTSRIFFRRNLSLHKFRVFSKIALNTLEKYTIKRGHLITSQWQMVE